MSVRISTALFLTVLLSIVGACTAENQGDESARTQAESVPQAMPSDGSSATGTVVETMNAGNYTYVRVNTDDGEIWAAATRFDVTVGETVVVPLEMAMQDFHSDTLDRTFPVIYFTSQIMREGDEAAAMPAGHPPVGDAMASSHDSAAVVEPVEPVDGGVTVARVWAETADLDGTEITVRGRVVKFNGGILGTNWIHLQDGTGSAADGTHDLTVTTPATVSVGDVITATGTLVTDQDFGAGYTYAVLLKDAEITTD